MADPSITLEWIILGADHTPVAGCLNEADAVLIVEAVNEHVARHRLVDVETLDHVASERDRLRELVRRMLLPTCVGITNMEAELKAVKGLCALKGIDASSLDKTRDRFHDLLREVREVVGEAVFLNAALAARMPATTIDIAARKARHNQEQPCQ